MVGTILPVVHGARRTQRFPNLLMLYTIASLLAAGLMGMFIAIVGSFFVGGLSKPVNRLWLGLLIGFTGLILGASELRVVPLSVPQLKRQVPHGWRFWRPPIMVSLYGAVLGLGFSTRIPVTTLYFVAVWSFLQADAVLACLVFSFFGLGRSLPLWYLRESRLTRSGYPHLYAMLSGWQEVIPVANGLALAFSSSYMIALGWK